MAPSPRHWPPALTQHRGRGEGQQQEEALALLEVEAVEGICHTSGSTVAPAAVLSSAQSRQRKQPLLLVCSI